MISVDSIVRQLETLALSLEKQGISEGSPHPQQRVEFNTKCGVALVKLQIFMHPLLLRQRSEKLIKTCRQVNRWARPSITKYRPPSLKVAKFSKAVAQRFLDDNETENYKNYVAIYQ